MKRCSCCKELKSESDFGVNRSSSDGLHEYCKSCARLVTRGFKASEIRKLNQDTNSGWDKVGGLRINILNHAKEGEHKFNISYVGENRVFTTDNQGQFLTALQQYLGRAA